MDFITRFERYGENTSPFPPPPPAFGTTTCEVEGGGGYDWVPPLYDPGAETLLIYLIFDVSSCTPDMAFLYA